jgi:hypothetical protein
MKNRDLIQEVIDGRLTGEEAGEIYLAINKWFHEQAPTGTVWSDKWIGWNKIELNAHAPFAVLAQWRKNGWPTHCYLCNKKLEPEIFGWFARKYQGKWGLRHVKCDDAYLAKIRQLAIERGDIENESNKQN